MKIKAGFIGLLAVLAVLSACGVGGLNERNPDGIQVIPNPVSFRNTNRSTVLEVTLRNTSQDSVTITGFRSTDPGFYVAERLPFRIPRNGFVQFAIGLDYSRFNGTRNVTLTLSFFENKIEETEILIEAPSRILPVMLSDEAALTSYVPFAISPNDQRLLYKRGRANSLFNLYTMTLDGRDINRITNQTGVDDNGVKWSRTGRYIIFNRTWLNTNPVQTDIYLFETATRELIRITENQRENIAVDMDASETNILFRSNRTGDWEVYTYNLTFQTANRLTNSPGFDGPIRYHPAGEGILFTSARGGQNQAYAMDIAGGNQRAITSFTGAATPVDISRTDARVLFVGERSTERDAYTVNFGGSNVVRVTSERLDIPFFFSPNGALVYLSSTLGDGVQNVYYVPSAGGVKRRLTFGITSEFPAAITSDGRFLIFHDSRRIPGSQMYLLDVSSINAASQGAQP